MSNLLKRSSVIAAAVLILAAASTAVAATIDDYRRRVDSALSGVEVLLGNIALEEAGQKAAQPDDEVFAELAKLLPATETVSGKDGTIETANQWFAEGVSAAEKELDLAKRAVVLTELRERLSALYLSLEELNAATAADRSKDEDKRKLAEILSRPEYQKPPEKEKSESTDLLGRFLRWLDSWFPRFDVPENSMGGIGAVGGLVQYLIVIAMLLVLGFVLYKLLPLFAPRFRRIVPTETTERVILGEKIGDDVSAGDLFADAERLAREGDVRGAIRKGYVALLCELGDRKLIGLARHKTNKDYVKDVRGRGAVHSQLNGLTGTFERHWYGSQKAAPQDWDEFRQRCGDTIKAI